MFKLIFFLLAALPYAFGSFIIGSTITSTIKCTTKLASTSTKSIPTSTKTKTVTLLPLLLTSVSTPVVTQTPSPTTSTSIATSVSTITITDSTITDTFSTTSSITTTITVSTTSTYTETDTASTTTTSTVSSGIATSSGFLPIESTLNGPPSKLKKRSAGHPHGPLEGRGQVSKGQGCAGNNYAAAVSCIDYIQVRSKVTFVLTAKSSTKTLPTSTVTVQSTTVSTSTSTVVPPDVSTTLSFSTTIPITITSTFQETATTTTTTTFIVTSTITGYDACATNNLLGPTYNGDTIDNLFRSGDGQYAASSTNSAYDCCVACISSTTCAASAFDTLSNRCFQMNSATCSNTQAHSGRFVYEPAGQTNGLALVISNSNCGYATDGGVGG